MVELNTGVQQRRGRFTRTVGLVLVAALVQACSDDAGSGSSERESEESSTTESTPVAEVVEGAPEGIAQFVARGTRPEGCPDLTDAPVQVSDPRAKWLISSRTVFAVDGFVSPERTVGIVTGPPGVDGSVGSVLHSDNGSGPTSVALDRTLVSVAEADDGRLYGLSLGEDGTKIVSIAQDGITTPVVELPEMPLAGSLQVDGSSYYLLDLTGFVEVEGPGPEQGVPVLAKVTSEGALEHFGVASSGAYAGLVDGVSLTGGTGDGVEVAHPSGEVVARAAFPGRYVGEQTWMIPNYSLSDTVVVRDGQVIGCARRYGTTEIGVYQTLHGHGH